MSQQVESQQTQWKGDGGEKKGGRTVSIGRGDAHQGHEDDGRLPDGPLVTHRKAVDAEANASTYRNQGKDTETMVKEYSPEIAAEKPVS